MKIRKRISIDEDLYNAAVEYSKLDNRTFSELMQTALKQMMNRYPKKDAYYDSDRFLLLKIRVDKMADELAQFKAKIS